MRSGTTNLALSISALVALASAMLLLIYATVLWVADSHVPLQVLGVGFALAVVALAAACLVGDKAALRRLLMPLALGFIAEYVLAFGTLALGNVSRPLQDAAGWLHYPGELLRELLFSGGGRSTIRRDATTIAAGEWLFIAVLLYLLQWYLRKRSARLSPAQPDGAANRSQPVRSETNRTSSAAGSGG